MIRWLDVARSPCLALCALTCFAGQAESDSLALTPCELPGHAGDARCGELEVPENPDLPDGRKIRIAVAVLPATGGPALPDPIVPLYGGPGERVIAEADFIARHFASLRRQRDILLVDQRGVGRSSALPCRLFDPGARAVSLRHFLPPERVEACARELAAKSDLTQYTYLHFARDLERVRVALGYAQFNLHSGSYGTRAAQVFMRAYPQSVRTAYLGSVVPIDYVTPLTMAKASQAQFEATFAACEADAACRAAYPQLRREFAAVIERLDAGAARAALPGADDARLDRGRAVEWLRSRLYRPAGAAEVPWLIHRAYEGDWSPVVEGILAQAREVDSAYALGLWLSITCSEDLAFLRPEDIAPATAGTWLGDFRVREQANACRAWPKARLPAGYREPVRSAIPTMLVSGDMDAAAPLSFTEHVAPGFPNRVEIVARGQGHTEPNDCVSERYREFVETGQARGIDPVCPAIPRPPFRVR
jgi:pimeloyl-ACP methyl ester carboxylesterase